MTARRKSWSIGNIVAAPLGDGTNGIGQIVGQEAKVLNSITVAFYRTRIKMNDLQRYSQKLNLEDLITIQFTTRELLKNGVWKVVGEAAVNIPQLLYPYEETRDQGWIGAKVIGSKNLVRFLRAYHGLEYWDSMHDPEYFEKLLSVSAIRSKELIFKRKS